MFMRAVLQRVLRSEVVASGKKVAEQASGLLVLLGIEEADEAEDVLWLVKKVTQMRLFPDAEGVMNCSVKELGGEVTVVSQFTLHAKTKKGNRPSYIRAARPEQAIPLYEQFLEELGQEIGTQRVQKGVFGAMMEVSLCNDGPITIILDSKNRDF